MITVVTPVFNNSHYTLEFIKTVVPLFMYPDDELIIVDNASSDDTKSIVQTSQKIFPEKIKYIENDTNYGFGKANNIGVAQAKNDIIAFISNDVKVLGNCLVPCITFVLDDNNVALGPRLINYKTGWNNFKENPVIPYIEGWFICTRKPLLDRVGGFDEEFFLDFDDADISYRLWLSGVSLAQINLPVIHSLGGSFNQLKEDRLSITLRSQKYFCKKWGLTPEDVEK